MTILAESWLALDVGGANIKAAHGLGLIRSVPFELWRRPDQLPAVLSRLEATTPPRTNIALTMTAELCDCYPTKRDGVRAVLDAVATGFPGVPVWVWGLDGRFHKPDAIAGRPLLAAASNWLALATVAARLSGPGRGLLIDVGSTTTDLIPLRDGAVAARGRTDTDRLQTGELVYAGVRRTAVCALANALPFRGRATAMAAELFATTGDVFLTLSDLPEEPDDLATADGRPATRERARDRLARLVCADRETFTDDDARRVAGSVSEVLTSRLVEAAGRAGLGQGGRPSVVVAAGAGEFLARRVAARIVAAGGRIIRLSETWGLDASAAACARALLAIASGASVPG